MEEMEIKEMKKGWRRWNQNSINGVGMKEVEWGQRRWSGDFSCLQQYPKSQSEEREDLPTNIWPKRNSGMILQQGKM